MENKTKSENLVFKNFTDAHELAQKSVNLYGVDLCKRMLKTEMQKHDCAPEENDLPFTEFPDSGSVSGSSNYCQMLSEAYDLIDSGKITIGGDI